MNDRAAYLLMIGNVINSQTKQCVVLKGYALAVCVSLFVITTFYNTGSTYPVINLALTSIIVLLWLQDGYSYRQKILYSRLYKKAVNEATVSFKMDNSAFQKDAPWLYILWRPQVCLIYIGIIIASAAISLIRI